VNTGPARAAHGDRWRRWLLAAGFCFVYLYAFPYFGELRSANEVPRVMLAQEIVRRGTFRLDARWAELQRGSTFDVSTTCGDPPRPKPCKGAPMHHYSNKAPGISLVAVPAVALTEAAAAEPSMAAATWVSRVFASTLPSLAFLPLFLLLARRFAPDEAPRRAALVAYALGSMALPYALLLFSHALAAACAGGAFVAAVRVVRGETRRPELGAIACGALAGASVIVDYQSSLAAGAVGIYLVVRSNDRVRHALAAAAGAIPSAVGLLLYHHVCFGSPWKTGYSFAEDPAHKQGVLGIVGPNAQAMWNALLAPDNGLVILMPWVLLAVVGGVAIARDRQARARVGAEAIVCGAIALGYVVFLGSLVPQFGRAGWSVGPRYIAVALPFFAWLAAAGLAAADRRPVLRALAHASILVGVIVFVVAATTFPHWNPAVKNPLWQVSFRILGEGLAPHSLGTAIGLTGVWSLLPIYLVAGSIAVWLLAGGGAPGSRARWVTTAAAAAIAIGVVVAMRWLPYDRVATAQHWNTIVRVWEPR
jgi:hypothetical protein